MDTEATAESTSGATSQQQQQPLPDPMPHEAEIVVPGSFVVFQGIPGDGLSNTIDTAPFLMEDYDHLMQEEEEHSASTTSEYHHVTGGGTLASGTTDNDVISYEETSSLEEDPTQPSRQQPAIAATSQRSPMMMGSYDSLWGSSNAAAASATTTTPAPTMTPLVLSAAAPSSPSGRAARTSLQQQPVDNSFVVVADDNEEKNQDVGDLEQSGLSRAQWEAIQHWETERRNVEVRERKEWQSFSANKPDEEEMWWQSRGRLAVLTGLPCKEQNVVQCTTCGSLAPGCTVVATRLVTLDSRTLVKIKDKKQNSKGTSVYCRGKKGIVQMLQIESPLSGHVVLSLDGYAFLGPGLPCMYTDSQAWMWRVTCPDGAFVREGLELTSTHATTLPYGSFLRISRKTVNSMGLSRLRIHAMEHVETDDDKDGRTLQVEGWISEELNPLSGQRGFIVQPVPFPVPALYRVRLSAGAVIRSDVELSSSQIGHAPMGAVLTVVGRAFSQHPMDQCIERFQLAGCGGWVSVRLNRPPPRNELVLEMIGIDADFDPENPGVFHLNAHDRVKAEHEAADLTDETRNQAHHEMDHDQREMYRRMSSGGDLSSINEEVSSSSSSLLSHPETTTSTATGTAVPTLFRSGVAAGGPMPRSGVASKMMGRTGDERCLICLTEDRNSTIVHGETGHIACCLKCARILKARGDRCPVCRLPIDSVIQHFWA